MFGDPVDPNTLERTLTLPGILASETMMYAAAIAALESDPLFQRGR